MSLDRLKINQRSYYDLSNSAFWGWLSVESQPQNPEFIFFILYTFTHAAVWSKFTRLRIIWKNWLFRYRENLQYKKTADSVWLGLFMRTNGKCNNSQAPSTNLGSILLFIRTQYSWRTRIWKNFNTISMHREKFYWKRTSKIQKQLQSRCSNKAK